MPTMILMTLLICKMKEVTHPRKKKATTNHSLVTWVRAIMSQREEIQELLKLLSKVLMGLGKNRKDQDPEYITSLIQDLDKLKI